MITSHALQCQGGAAIWATIGPALPPPALFVLTHEFSVVDRLVPFDADAPCVALTLDTPPPEGV